MKILVAEDDSDTAGFIRRGLGELGHNVVVAQNGMDALYLLLVENFDAAVVDRMLPRLDGLSVVQRVRAARDRSGKHPSLAVHVAVGLIVTAGLIMLMPDMAPDASAAASGATEASALSVADASHSHPAAETLPAALTLALMIGHTVLAAAGVRADRIARHRVHHIAMGCSTIAMGLIVVS